MANKGQRMIFEDEYQYLKDVKENYPDPSDIGGGNKYVTIPSNKIGQALSDEDFDNLVNNGYDIILDDGNQTSIYYRNYENNNAIQFVQSELGGWHDGDSAKILLYQLEVNKTTKVLSMNNNVETVIKANVTVESGDTTVPLTNLQFNGYGDIYTIPSVPTDYVTTDTNQYIDATKSFDEIYVKSSPTTQSYVRLQSGSANTKITVSHNTSSLDKYVILEPNRLQISTNTSGKEGFEIKVFDTNSNSNTYTFDAPTNGTSQTFDVATTDDIPTDVSELNNDAGYITGIDSSMVTTALGYTPGTSNFSGSYTDLTDKPDLSIYAQSANLATVATSGSYNDLTDKPSALYEHKITVARYNADATLEVTFNIKDNNSSDLTLAEAATALADYNADSYYPVDNAWCYLNSAVDYRPIRGIYKYSGGNDIRVLLITGRDSDNKPTTSALNATAGIVRQITTKISG